MTKRLLFLILVLTGIASAQYNSVLNIQVRSGAAVPGSCSPDGSLFFKNTTTKDWYKCIAGSYVAIGSVSGTVTSVGLSTDSSFLTVGSSPVTGAGTITLNLTTGLAANKALMTPNGSTGTVSLRTIDAADIGTGAFTLAGARFANNGTTTTVLHGNAAGNPSFGSIVNGDIAAGTIDLTAKVTGILPTANGGTANAFFTVAGPATSAKTFTFPNASANVLTDNAVVTAAQGGSGVASPTAHGVLLGEEASAFVALVCGADTVVHGLASADPNCASLTNATGGAAAVTYDTSAHTFGALSNILTATLTSTRVPFASGANALTDSANLVYAAASGFTQIQGANAADTYVMKRATDTSSTGNFLRFRNNAATTDLFTVDVNGNVSAVAYSATNASGNAGMVSLVQGTAPSNVTNAVNLLAPTSVTTYALTYPGTIAAGLWRTNSGGVYSIAELSGDATTSGSNVVTVPKVNGVAYPTTGSSFDAIPVLTASNSVSYFQINAGADCGDSTHALKYTQSTHLIGCQAITAAAPGAGGSNTQVQFNSSNTLAGSANLTWVSPTLTIGAAGATTGQLAIAGSTSGSVTHTAAVAAGGTVTWQNKTGDGGVTTGTLTNGNGAAYDSSGRLIDGGFVAANVVTASGAAGAAGQIPYSAGANRALSYLSLSPSTQTDGATITWAIASVPFANATVTLGGNRTLNITNPVTGGNYVLRVVQDATGSRGLTLGTGCTWKVSGGGAGAITPSTAANAIDILTFYYDGTNCYANFNKNFS